MKPHIGVAAIKLIEAAVSRLFGHMKSQTIGDKHPTGKHLYFAHKPELTLKGIYNSAASEEGSRPNEAVFKSLAKITNSYFDAAEAKAKAKVVHAVTSFLQDAGNKNIKTNLNTVLNGKISEVMGEVHRDIKRIVETESTIFRNTSILDGISKANALAGVEDPTVFFVTVRDNTRCKECTRLHVQPDGITPRVWKMSELGGGYHKKGDSNPKISGLHPHCRCVLTTLMPGFGFNSAGMVQYKSPEHDEYKAQRGII